MIIFNTDLDNTIIYSYKHDIGENKICAEIYQNREISFITDKTAQLLKAVNSAVTLVPTTTRTLEQYNRINLGFGVPEYALVCNGGVLLVNGEEDEEWYSESLKAVSGCREELSLAEKILERDVNRTLEVRNIRRLFIFTKSDKPLESVGTLKGILNTDKVDVFNNGVKVYVVSKGLSKGIAVKRLKEKLGADKIVAAGDSEFDLSMLSAADTAIAPKELSELAELPEHTVMFDGEGIFSEFVLEKVLAAGNAGGKPHTNFLD
ncbi:MAG: HAD hydrolase family protein [Clostridia bacterium]|nr:HAD hydrolase family protein [Clostridia bacterium]